ncbi:MAG: asparaginase domain-containing protein [Sphaerochaetaceae bacterium]
MLETEELCIITTGGTFDKYYDEIKGELTFRESHLPRILKASRCSLAVAVEPCIALDSLFMDDSHREKIAATCASRHEKRIIITHGTDTMVQTAHVVAARKLPKVVVLTGAMVPYALENSDAVFNLGCAISAVQLLPVGVYICMSGKVFPYDQVNKNRDIGVFTGQAIQTQLT